jgi:hypothetical protein
MEKVRELMYRWKCDLHALINRFTTRILDGKNYMVTIHYEETIDGRLQRIVTRVPKEKVSTSFGDCRFTLPRLGKNMTYWTPSELTLCQYLTTDNPLAMKQQEKKCYNELEFYPARPEEGERVDRKSKNLLNTFAGLDITRQNGGSN